MPVTRVRPIGGGYNDPSLNLDFVPDAAGAHQNALQSRGMEIRNALAPRQLELDERSVKIQELAWGVREEALKHKMQPDPISIDIGEATLTGLPEAVAAAADKIGQFAGQVESLDQLTPWLAREGVSVERKAPETPEKLYQTEEGYLPRSEAIGKKAPEKTTQKLGTIREGVDDSGKPIVYRVKPDNTIEIIQDVQPKPKAGMKFYDRETGNVIFDSTGGKDEARERKATFEMESKLRKEFTGRPEVKSFIEIESHYDRSVAALQKIKEGTGSMNAVDQSLIMLMNKILDPESVVRESEYARTPEGMSLLNRLEGWFDRMKRGGAGLNDSERTEIFGMIERFYNVAVDTYNVQVNYYHDLAEQYGIPPENVLRKKGIEEPKAGFSNLTDDELLNKLSE